MLNLIAVRPLDVWNVVFHRQALMPVMKRWPGEFKHVSAFTVCDRTLTFYNWTLTKSGYWQVRDSRTGWDFVERWTEDAEIVAVQTQERAWWMPRFGCAMAVQHMLGLPGCALSPDALYRQCLRVGKRYAEDDESAVCSELRAL